jgi:hypothetical protein
MSWLGGAAGLLNLSINSIIIYLIIDIRKYLFRRRSFSSQLLRLGFRCNLLYNPNL